MGAAFHHELQNPVSTQLIKEVTQWAGKLITRVDSGTVGCRSEHNSARVATRRRISCGEFGVVRAHRTRAHHNGVAVSAQFVDVATRVS
jgi:hypothetical protein